MLSYVLAFLAGLVNATGNVLNRKAARDEPDQAEFRLKLITDLMHRKVWLAAVGLMIISFALAAAALGTGQLASVQLVVVLELPMTIMGGAWLLRAPLGIREWVAIGLENAYQAGPLTASQPGITLVDPAVSTVWGVVVFGETINHGTLLALTALPAIAVAVGVFLLSRSRVLRATQVGDRPGAAASRVPEERTTR